MAKRVLSKIQVPPEYSLPLVARIHQLDFLEIVKIDSQSPSELAKIEDQRTLFTSYRQRFLTICSALNIDTSVLMEYDDSLYSLVSEPNSFSSTLDSFLNKHESSILSLSEQNELLTKKHLIADKLHYFRHKFNSTSIPLELLSPGPSTFSTIGEIHKSYETIFTFYLDELTKGQYYLWSIESSDPDFRLIFLLTSLEYKNEVLDLLEEHYFSSLDFDLNLFEDLKSSDEQQVELSIANVHDFIHEEDLKLKSQLTLLHDALREEILTFLTALNLIIELFSFIEQSRTTEENFTLWGWIAPKNYLILEEKIKDFSFPVKLFQLSDVPIKYKKQKKIKKECGDLMFTEEKKTKKDIPPYSYIGDSKGGTLFPRNVDFVKLEVPKEYSRNLISFLHQSGILHQEKVGIQPAKILEQIREKRQTLNSLLLKINKYKNYFQLEDKPLELEKKFILEDNYESSIDFVNQFISEYGTKIENLYLEISELKEKHSQLNIYLPFQEYFFSEGKADYLITEDFETCSFLGSIPSKNVKPLKFFLQEVTDNRLVFFEAEQPQKSDLAYIFVLSLNDYRRSIEQIFGEYSFEALPHNPEFLNVQSLGDQITEIENQILDKETEFNEIKEIVKTKILAISELIQVELSRLETEEKCKTDSETTTIWGWVPSNQIDELKKKTKHLDFPITISEKQKVPLNNPSLTTKGNQVTRVFRGLVDGMGVPSTHEIDPFKIMQFTFPLIFGIMFADVGHGILLALVGLFLSYKKRKNKIEPDESLTGYLYKGSELLTISGLSAIVFGFLFGALLGDEVLLANFYEHVLHIDWLPILEPAKEVPLFLVFSLTIGFIIMQIGIWFRFIENKKYNHGVAAWVSPIILSVFYVGLFLIIYNIMGAGATSRLLENPLPTIPKPYSSIATIVTLVSIVLVFVFEYLHAGSDGIMEAIDHILSLFSNTLSFSRILAMLLVHAILSGLPYLFSGIDTHTVSVLETSWVFWIIGLLWGMFVIVPIEGLFSFLQTLRLHWVEFFSKFYKGEGFQFSPLYEKKKFIEYSSVLGD
ncbi:MAG: V-type ATPase 116kDa subunit family protein [Candidatus Heimdallarchaeaceae archaeon]